MAQNWFDQQAKQANWFTQNSPQQGSWFAQQGGPAPTNDQESWWDKPLLDIRNEGIFDPAKHPMLAGAERATEEAVSGISTPKSLGTIAALTGAAAIPVIGPAVEAGASLYFIGGGLSNMWDESKAAYNSQGEERYYHATKALLDNLQVGIAAKAGSHAFNRVAADSLVDFVPKTGNIGKLTSDLREIFNAKAVSENTSKATSLLREDSFRKALQYSQLKQLYEKQSVLFDKVGEAAYNNPDFVATQTALSNMLKEKLANLPEKEAGRIMEMDGLPKNPIDRTLAQTFEADRSQISAETVKALDTAGLVKNTGMKSEGFEVFDTSTGKTVKSFAGGDTAETKASEFADTKPQYDYRPVEGVPEGWKIVNFPSLRNIAVEDEPGSIVTKSKKIYAPGDVADLLNNYLAPGLDSIRIAGPAYQIYRGIGNILNQFQLGFSVFHLGFVAMDSMVSGAAQGIRKMVAGQLAGGAAEFAKGVTPYYSISRLMEGSKIIKGVLSGSEEFNQELEWLQKAGSRVKQDPFYQLNPYSSARQNIMRAWRQKELPTLGDALRFLPEIGAYATMEKIVPAMKVGIFMDMARFEMEQLAKRNAGDWEVREALGKVWDSVDNRMGQIVYDNLMIPKWAKQLGMASIRSLGWNIGTFRELGGGIKDWGEFLSTPFKTAQRQAPQLTHRMLYTVTLPLVTGAYGGLLHYGMTGKPPEELQDLWFPKNSAGNRVSLPSYMKDVFEFADSPKQTAFSKLHPLGKAIVDMLENSDYRNVHITEENLLQNIKDGDGKGILQWFLDEGGYVKQQFMPFGLTTYNRSREQGSTMPEALGSLVGLAPAPQRVVGSDFEQMAKKIISEASPEGGRTKLQAARSTAILGIEDRLRNGQNPQELIDSAMSQGMLSNEDMHTIMTQARMPVVQSLGEKLSIPDFVKAFNVATPEEKMLLTPILNKKLKTMTQQSPMQQEDSLKALDRIKMSAPLPPPPFPQ